MDQDDAQDPKLEARKAALELRRARLRDLADSVLDSTESMDKPKTWLEAGRATRVIGGMDRVMVRLYSEPDLRCVTAMERAARRLKLDPLPEMDEAPEEPHSPESLARKQRELENRILRFIKMRKGETSYASVPDERPAEQTSGQAPLWTDDPFAGSTLYGPPHFDTPIPNKPKSHTSGDATPAPNIAKKEPPPRSGPSIRSLGPDWPPW